VNSAEFSRDGGRVVTASDIFKARIWDAQSGKPIGEPLCHTNRVTSAAFSSDGSRVVTASYDNTARIWDAQSGKPLGEPLRHEGEVKSAKFSSDGSRVVTASLETARIWDAQTGKPLGEPLRHEGDVTSASFSSDGSRVVTASSDNTARVWNLINARALVLCPTPQTIFDRASAIAGFSFSSDGELRSIPAEVRLSSLQADAETVDAWGEMFRWLSAPSKDRTVTPSSKVTNAQIAERERDTLTREGLQSALRYDPAVPLARLLLSGFEKNVLRADFLRKYDLDRLPDDAEIWARASTILQNQGQTQPAIAAARKAIQLNPKLVTPCRVLAAALERAGAVEESLAAYETLLTLTAANANDYGNAGYFAAKLDRAERARAIFSEGEARFPEEPHLVKMRGWAAINLNAPDEALAEFLRSAAMQESQNPKVGVNWNTLAGLAVSRLLTGDQEGAVLDLKRVLTLKPLYADGKAFVAAWTSAESRPMLELLAETLKRHPELAPRPTPPKPE
jgi:tetratricopeptide (TPR) repeat protein